MTGGYNISGPNEADRRCFETCKGSNICNQKEKKYFAPKPLPPIKKTKVEKQIDEMLASIMEQIERNKK
jgi:hypothetical protein